MQSAPDVATKQHEVAWDESKIARFWGVVSNVLGENFFSHVACETFLAAVGKDLGRSVLDVGCGDGFLVRALRERGFDAWGVDPAPANAPYLQQASGSEIAKLGAARFDSVVSLETFEHILPAKLPDTLRAISQVVKPAGVLAFTVPYQERLDNLTCVCPDCHAVFHRWQHLQAFTPSQITTLLDEAGFENARIRRFSIPYPIPFVPKRLLPVYSRFYAWVKTRMNRDVGMLVTARRAR